MEYSQRESALLFYEREYLCLQERRRVGVESEPPTLKMKLLGVQTTPLARIQLGPTLPEEAHKL
jgi:hypothetical protein